ncbi:MAG: hypothetical protein JO271_05565, partial [Verrucomicrobia bacterium]|nr:hypothetical protein [Verrucomicrobiota bacterium]
MASAPTTTAEFGTGQELVRGSSLWSDAWFRLKKNHLALFGLGFFLFMTCICLLGPFFTGYRYEDTDLPLKASPPLDKVISRIEHFKNGEMKKEFLALSNVEDEFLDLPRPERKTILAKLAKGEQYTTSAAATVIPGGMAGKNITYEPSPERHLFGTDPLGRDLLT